MKQYKSQDKKKTATALPEAQTSASQNPTFIDNRPQAHQVKQLQQLQKDSPTIQKLNVVQRMMQAPIQRLEYGAINEVEEAEKVPAKFNPRTAFQAAVHSVMKGVAGKTIFMEEASRKRDEGKVKKLSDQQLSRHVAGVDAKKGQLTYKTADGKNAALNTDKHFSHEKQGFAAFVLDEAGKLSLFNHSDGSDGIKHSTFSKGKPVIGAGELRIENGKLTHLTAHSGHYKPRAADLANVLRALASQGLNVAEVKVLMSNETFQGSSLKAEQGIAPEKIPGTSKYISPEDLKGIEAIAADDARADVKDAEKLAAKEQKVLTAADKEKLYKEAYAKHLKYYKGNQETQSFFDKQVSGKDLMTLKATKPSAARLESQGFTTQKPKPKPKLGPPPSSLDLLDLLDDLPSVDQPKAAAPIAEDDLMARLNALQGLPNPKPKEVDEDPMDDLQKRLDALKK
ncbi:MAG: hypothetical protein AB8G15_12010 [Saprospiraceae bacterium]